MSLSRRAVTAGLAASAAACARQAPAPAPMQSRQFPADFTWGVATSAFQIEGAVREGGRGESIWDVFQRQPGKIIDGANADEANDSYHRYAEDVARIGELGAGAYRFSIAWPRIQPTAAGAANEAGLDYYSRLIDALLARNITPYATLFHWDLPQALQDQGGWTARDTASRFAEYADIVWRRLSDRLRHVIVLNEPAVHAVLGHVTGEHAPGTTNSTQLGPIIHHLNLAQGLALQAMRATNTDAQFGTTLALQPIRAEAAFIDLPNRMAAGGFDEIWNRAFLDPLLKGTYPDRVTEMIGAALQPDDLRTTNALIDFLGVNYYAPTYIRFDASSPSQIAVGKIPVGAPADAFGRHVDARGLEEVLTRLRNEYRLAIPIHITENGCSDPFGDGPAEMNDAFRIAYLRQHLEAVKRAMEAGSDVRGYFHWTLADNWEWALGFTSKFGLCDHARAPKASFAWFSALARSGLLDAA